MVTLAVETDTLDVAYGVYGALAEFSPELSVGGADDYGVTVELGDDEGRVVSLLDALERYFSAGAGGSASVDFGGRTYVLHVPPDGRQGGDS
jgi:hypothetical protein